MYLKEDYQNTIEDLVEEENKKQESEEEKPENIAYIQGENCIYPYDIKTYQIINSLGNGIWSIDNNYKAKILKQDNNSVSIEVTTGKSGFFNLIYTNESEVIKLPITIKSL